MAAPSVHRALAFEARALLTRLARVKPIALQETMLPAAALSLPAQAAIEGHLAAGRAELRRRARDFLAWVEGPAARAASPEEAQRRFVRLRLAFNVTLEQLDLFADAVTQRSESDTGVWLAGLEVAARDALELPFVPGPPPVVCYLDRGPGAAIRRARTRLPGGGENPVAIVRLPRERMIGCGIASSLAHEVGHQGSALLGLVDSLRPVLAARRRAGAPSDPWACWERWISEVIADLWAVARVGVAATLGLLAVVSLPRAFVFRANLDDPHPTPWVRVRLSCALGRALYPDPQWDRLASLWASFYPVAGLDEAQRSFLDELETTTPAFIELLLRHRPSSLRGRSLGEALAGVERTPARLRALWIALGASPLRMRRVAPTLAFAAIGQARIDGRVTPEEEGHTLAYLLKFWALRSSLEGWDEKDTRESTRRTRRDAALAWDESQSF